MAISKDRATALDDAIAAARKLEQQYWGTTGDGADKDKTPQWYMAKAAAAGEIAYAIEQLKLK